MSEKRILIFQLQDDGWLKTGDIAYRDKDGLIYMVDRKKVLPAFSPVKSKIRRY